MAMKRTNETSDRVLTILGTVMMVAWFVVIGLGGFVLLLAAFYAMTSNHLTLLVITCFALCLPLALTLIWGLSAIDRWVRESRPQTDRSASRAPGTHAPGLACGEAPGR